MTDIARNGGAYPEVIGLDLYETEIVLTAPLTHLCPYVDEQDVGVITVGWSGDKTLEMHSLDAYLAAWANAKVSHEDITALIAGDLATALGFDVHVETEWTTAGITVRVTVSA